MNPIEAAKAKLANDIKTIQATISLLDRQIAEAHTARLSLESQLEKTNYANRKQQ